MDWKEALLANRCERLTASVVQQFGVIDCAIAVQSATVNCGVLILILSPSLPYSLHPPARQTPSPPPSHSFMCVHLAGLSGERAQ